MMNEIFQNTFNNYVYLILKLIGVDKIITIVIYILKSFTILMIKLYIVYISMFHRPFQDLRNV